jgi:hypothetical protein
VLVMILRPTGDGSRPLDNGALFCKKCCALRRVSLVTLPGRRAVRAGLPEQPYLMRVGYWFDVCTLTVS